jgi:hypothetical protein
VIQYQKALDEVDTVMIDLLICHRLQLLMDRSQLNELLFYPGRGMNICLLFQKSRGCELLTILRLNLVIKRTNESDHLGKTPGLCHVLDHFVAWPKYDL